jgi:adenylate cyclase, class 2
MHYEIEQKFRVDDFDGVRERLAAIGAAPGEALDQADCYYRHPMRDFAKTDEAFRLRRVGEHNCLTYKGPKIDATTKSRFEQEAALADGPPAADACDEILRRLGFEPVTTVRKHRETFELVHEGIEVEAALDEVERVGKFVELEAGVEVEGDDHTGVDAAKRVLAALAGQLGLANSERRSYLELLLQAGDSTPET